MPLHLDDSGVGFPEPTISLFFFLKKEGVFVGEGLVPSYLLDKSSN